MSKATDRETDRQEAIKTLRKMGVRPGSRIYTGVSNASRSGMSRHIHCYIVAPSVDFGKRTHRIFTISGLVARAIGAKRDNRSGGIVRGGCGMDLGFDTVYSLGRAMFPKGGDLKHSPRAHQEREKGKETDGGYLLKHEWL